MFNDQLKEALKKALMAKFGDANGVPMPVAAPTQGLANMVGGAVSKLPADFMDPQPLGPVPASPEEQAAVEAADAATVAPKPAISAPPAVNKPVISAPAIPQQNPLHTVEPTPAPVQQSAMPTLGSEYNNEARQQLYAQLAAKRKENAGWAAAGSLGDMAMRMGGNTPIGTQQNILAQGNKDDAAAREQFEAGRKGQMEDFTTGLAMKKAGREDAEYTDQNDPNSQQSKLAVALALKYAPDQAKKLGWQAGKSTYADVIKVLPIMEKGIAMEQARADRALKIGEKTDQYNNTKIDKFRTTIQSSDPYKTMVTLRNVRAAADQAIKNPSPYGDVQLIYAAVKAFDPNSVVREGEISLFQGAAGYKSRLQAALSRAYSGKTLTPEQRQDVLSILDNYEKTAESVLSNHIAPTRQQMESMGLKNRMGEIDPLLSKFDSQAPAPTTGKKTSGGFTVIR